MPIEQRDRWRATSSFILAAIGAAIGLGNIWRFPFVCAQNGGGAFLVAYLVVMVFCGFPLLMMEFGIGNIMQRGAPGAFRAVRRGLEWVGWWATLVSVVVMSYYVVICAWAVDYAWFSLDLRWGDDTVGFFQNEFLGDTGGALPITALRPAIVIGLLISWVCIIGSIWKGVISVGKVVWVTVLVPWAILIILIIRGVTLDGAGAGLAYYLIPEWGRLLDQDVWLAAFGQVFFSLGIGFAMMITYASFLPEKSPIIRNALIIGLADGMTAVLGGLAVFGALGHEAARQSAERGITVAVESIASAGGGLAFQTYPAIINHLAGARLFGFLFFAMLVLLAVDSAFAMVEVLCTAINDKWKTSRKKTNVAVGVFGLFAGLIFCTGGGSNWLDIVDAFINDYSLVAAACVQAIVIGVAYGPKRLWKQIHAKNDPVWGFAWSVCAFVITPLALIFIVVGSTEDKIEQYQTKADSRIEAADLVGVETVKDFAAVIIAEAGADSASPGKKLWAELDAASRAKLEALAAIEVPEFDDTRDEALFWSGDSRDPINGGLIGDFIEAIEPALKAPDLYQTEAWTAALPPDEKLQALLGPARDGLTTRELARRNRLLLEAAYPDRLASVKDKSPNLATFLGGWLVVFGMPLIAIGLMLIPGREDDDEAPATATGAEA